MKNYSNESLLLTLFQGSNDLIYTFNREDETYGLVNKAFADTFSTSVEELSGKKPHDIFPPEEANVRLEKFRNILKTGEPEKFTVSRKINQEETRFYQIVATPIKTDDSEISTLLCVSRDITEEILAKKELVNEQMFTQSIIESIPGYFSVYDELGNLIHSNSLHTKLIGEQCRTISGIDFPQILVNASDSGKILEKINEILVNGFGQMEVAIKNEKGATTWIKLTGKRLFLNGSKYIVSVGIDITKRKQAELALENYVQTVNHDLRSPLSGLISLSNLILEEEMSLDEVKQIATCVNETAKELLDLMENFLLLNKIENGRSNINLEKMTIAILIEKIKSFVSSKYKDKAKFSLRDINNSFSDINFLNRSILVNKNLLISLLTNLINNAQEASADVTMVNIYKNKGFCLSVTNSGEIPPEIQVTLFDKFTTNKKKGNGIGLYSAKLIASAHNGDLVYTPLPGKTRFTLTIPFVSQDYESP